VAGIYIHIPFCFSKCIYCDFYSTKSNEDEKILFIEAIKDEIESRKHELSYPIETIYVGGGTPNSLSVVQLEEIIKQIRKHFDVVEKAEISIELNPAALSKEYFSELKRIGINRVSLGVQSIYKEELKYLGRKHSREDALTTIENLCQVIKNYSIDFIFGFPPQSPTSIKNQIKEILKFSPQHFSIYSLTVEENTPLKKLIDIGKREVLSEAEQEEIYKQISTFLQSNDFEHYEISNYAKKGMRSKHNSSYWNGNQYLGFGPGAHSYTGNNRYWNEESISNYLQKNIKVSREFLDEKDKINEKILLSLRQEIGMDMNEIEGNREANKMQIQQNIRKQIENKNLCINNNRLIIPKEKWFLSDRIISDLFVE
jgi:putative oxygen-independent coproporphyrinogen III oxidase